MRFSFLAPRLIEFGSGVAGKLVEHMDSLGLTRPLVITSAGMRKREPFQALLASFKTNPPIVYDDVYPEPPKETLEAVLEFADGQDVDSVIGVGGGSVIDIAKLTALLLVDPGPIERLFGVGKVQKRGLPTFMIPTTTGSGSEVTANAVLLAPTQKTKLGVVDAKIIPEAAFIDPDMVATLPANLVATSGMDALSHAMEAYVSKNASPISDALAFKAIKLVVDNLVLAVEGHGPEREALLQAAMIAGLAFSNAGTGAVHAFAYPLTGVCGISHGLANALMLPYVVEFNRVTTPKYAELDCIFKGDIVNALFQLRQDVELPGNLTEAGVDSQMSVTMAEIAINVRRHLAVNPREVTFDDAVDIFTKAMA